MDFQTNSSICPVGSCLWVLEEEEPCFLCSRLFSSGANTMQTFWMKNEWMLVVIGNTGQFLAQVLFAHVSSGLHFSEPAFLMLLAMGWTFKQLFCKKRLYWACPLKLSSFVPLPLKLHWTHLRQLDIQIWIVSASLVMVPVKNVPVAYVDQISSSGVSTNDTG